MKHLPNLLSYSRIFLTLLIDLSIFNQRKILALILIILAASTDFFDGYLARKFNTVTKYGANLDLIADKTFSLNMLIVLLINTKDAATNIIILLLISRELVMILLRNYYKKDIPASYIGKLKTVLLNTAYVFYLLHYPSHTLFLYIAAVFSSVSQLQYIRNDAK